MSSPHILHLRGSSFVGGPEQQLLHYAESERDGAFQIRLGTFVGPGEGSEFLRVAEARGFHILSLPCGSTGFRSALPTLVREMRIRRVDLLCTHGYKADILGVLAARASGTPVACFLRGWTSENGRIRFYEAIDRFIFPFAQRIVCLSEHQALRFRKRRLLASQIRIVQNAVDLPDIRAENIARIRKYVRELFGFPVDCPLIASAGRLSPEKGVHVFLDASAAIVERYPETRFLIFGDGFLRGELEAKSRRLGLGDRLRFSGFITELRELLSGLDVLVNPSLTEEMPNIVLEGMAAEIPVVATAVGGVPEISAAGQAVMLILPGDPKSIVEAVSFMIQNPNAAKELAIRGRARVQQAYSSALQRVQLQTLYRGLLPTAPRSLPQPPG
jgi:glycosyltransferase involved in cell wall biosynthesis